MSKSTFSLHNLLLKSKGGQKKKYKKGILSTSLNNILVKKELKRSYLPISRMVSNHGVLVLRKLTNEAPS